MRIRVVDIETTGTDPEQDRICEIGWTDVLVVPEGFAVGNPMSILLDPEVDMPPEAKAVHHISNEDVFGCVSHTQASILLFDGLGQGDYVAAHNAKFERSFLSTQFPWICTMQCAKHLLPDAPSFGNQVLRYWLGFELDHRAMPPHRAGPDTFVTAHILTQLATLNDPDDTAMALNELVRLTNELVLLRGPVTFGMHKGKSWKELPKDYLRWIVNKSDLDAETKHTARHHLSR